MSSEAVPKLLLTATGVPVDPKKWGPITWRIIHYNAIDVKSLDEIPYFIKTLRGICSRLPCSTCKKHAAEYLRDHPPEKYIGTAPDKCFRYTVDFHNYTNSLTHASQISYEAALRLYSDTFIDAAIDCGEGPPGLPGCSGEIPSVPSPPIPSVPSVIHTGPSVSKVSTLGPKGPAVTTGPPPAPSVPLVHPGNLGYPRPMFKQTPINPTLRTLPVTMIQDTPVIKIKEIRKSKRTSPEEIRIPDFDEPAKMGPIHQPELAKIKIITKK